MEKKLQAALDVTFIYERKVHLRGQFVNLRFFSCPIILSATKLHSELSAFAHRCSCTAHIFLVSPMHHAQHFARVLKELKGEPVLRSPKGARRYAAD